MITDDGRIGRISLVMRRCRIGGVLEDQTNRGLVPPNIDPPTIRHVDSQYDSLVHRAEFSFRIAHI